MVTESSEEEDDEIRDVRAEIRGLRTSETELLEKARPLSQELDKVTLRKRESIDKLHRLIAEKHDREKYQRIIELQSELKRLKWENKALKHTNSTIDKYKQSLDHALKDSRLKAQTIEELNAKISALQQPRSADISDETETARNSNKVTELQEQLHETKTLLSQTKEELNETRQRLSDVQERMTVAEQVTAATQQRELQESDNSEQLELTPQQPTVQTGFVNFITFRESAQCKKSAHKVYKYIC